MATLREYYQRLAEDNRKLQERIRKIEAEQSEISDKADGYDIIVGDVDDGD